MFCKNCGNEVGERAGICPSCGANPKKNGGYCGNCGERLNKDAVICIKCGCSTDKSAVLEGNNKVLAIVSLDIAIAALVVFVLSWNQVWAVFTWIPAVTGLVLGAIAAKGIKFKKPTLANAGFLLASAVLIIYIISSWIKVIL